MTSHVFWPFLTYLVLLYNVPFLVLSWTPLPTLIWDVINKPSPIKVYKCIKKSSNFHLNDKKKIWVLVLSFMYLVLVDAMD